MDTDDYQMDSNEASVIVSPVKVNNVSTIENKAKMEKATNGNNSVFSLKSKCFTIFLVNWLTNRRNKNNYILAVP